MLRKRLYVAHSPGPTARGVCDKHLASSLLRCNLNPLRYGRGAISSASAKVTNDEAFSPDLPALHVPQPPQLADFPRRDFHARRATDRAAIATMPSAAASCQSSDIAVTSCAAECREPTLPAHRQGPSLYYCVPIDRWKWTCFQAPSFFCQTRVSSNDTVCGAPAEPKP